MLSALTGGQKAIAQTATQDWTDPINISKSGLTSDPQLVIDTNGTYHAIWKDKVNGYMYARSEDGQLWSDPIKAKFPFSSDVSSPVFVVGTNGMIHIFWVNQANALYYSRMTFSSFGKAELWIQHNLGKTGNRQI